MPKVALTNIQHCNIDNQQLFYVILPWLNYISKFLAVKFCYMIEISHFTYDFQIKFMYLKPMHTYTLIVNRYTE